MAGRELHDSRVREGADGREIAAQLNEPVAHPDKRTILLAAYEAWVTTEWQAIGTALRAISSPAERAERIVDLVLPWRTAPRMRRIPIAAGVKREAHDGARRSRQCIPEPPESCFASSPTTALASPKSIQVCSPK